MNEISEILNGFPLADTGATESRLKGVLYFKEIKHIPRRPMVYDPGICIVTQGYKVGHLGENRFQYDADNYLVTSISMPFECETFGTPEKPLLGIYICIDMAQLHDLIGRMSIEMEPVNGGIRHYPGQLARLLWIRIWRMQLPGW
ncbi:MAG: AraC family transcriptional regulator [Desulfobacteraceae bacterium]|jgi:hypothetical protein